MISRFGNQSSSAVGLWLNNKPIEHMFNISPLNVDHRAGLLPRRQEEWKSLPKKYKKPLDNFCMKYFIMRFSGVRRHVISKVSSCVHKA